MEYYVAIATYNTLMNDLYKPYFLKGRTSHRTVVAARKEAYASLMKMPYGDAYIIARRKKDGIPEWIGTATKHQSHVFSGNWDTDFIGYKARGYDKRSILRKDGTLGRRY